MATASQIRSKAKEIFSATYNYPRMPFRSIGRACFKWALVEARRQLTEAERLAALPAEAKAARIAELHNQLALSQFSGSYRAHASRAAAIEAEIKSLAA
jgi:hypothetical protein